MKRIVFGKTVETTFANNKVQLNYEANILDSLEATDPRNPRPFSIKEIKTSLSIIKKIEDQKVLAIPYVDLDDSEYEHLKSRIESTGWMMATKEVDEFLDSILNAKDPTWRDEA